MSRPAVVVLAFVLGACASRPVSELEKIAPTPREEWQRVPAPADERPLELGRVKIDADTTVSLFRESATSDKVLVRWLTREGKHALSELAHPRHTKLVVLTDDGREVEAKLAGDKGGGRQEPWVWAVSLWDTAVPHDDWASLVVTLKGETRRFLAP